MAILTVSSAASTHDLTLLVNAKQELDITDGGSDSMLLDMITQVSKQIDAYLGRVLARETVVEYVPGTGSVQLRLNRYPVSSITSIVIDGSTLTEGTDYVVAQSDLSAGLVYRPGGWRWSAPLAAGAAYMRIPGEEEAEFVVTYAAGYILPGMSGTRDLPEDLERACLEMVKHRYNSRAGSGGGASGTVRQVSTPGIRVQWDTLGSGIQTGAESVAAARRPGSFGFTAEVERLLSPYRRVVMA